MIVLSRQHRCSWMSECYVDQQLSSFLRVHLGFIALNLVISPSHLCTLVHSSVYLKSPSPVLVFLPGSLQCPLLCQMPSVRLPPITVSSWLTNTASSSVTTSNTLHHQTRNESPSCLLRVELIKVKLHHWLHLVAKLCLLDPWFNSVISELTPEGWIGLTQVLTGLQEKIPIANRIEKSHSVYRRWDPLCLHSWALLVPSLWNTSPKG